MNESDFDDNFKWPRFADTTTNIEFEIWWKIHCKEEMEKFLTFDEHGQFQLYMLARYGFERLLLTVKDMSALMQADNKLLREKGVTVEKSEFSRLEYETVKASRALRKRELALALGRKKGARAQREIAAKNKELIASAYRDLLKHPDWARKSKDDIAGYLCNSFAQTAKIVQPNGRPYSPSTIRKWMKRFSV